MSAGMFDEHMSGQKFQRGISLACPDLNHIVMSHVPINLVTL